MTPYPKINRVLGVAAIMVFLVLCSNSLLSQTGNCNTTFFPDQWQVHKLESTELPYRAVYILPQEDLDGDGLKDIVTGAWWYKNPGLSSGNWVRKTIGNPFKNVAFLHDFDNDGDIDLLGTQGDYKSADMAWAQNDGSGNFTVRTNIPSGRTTYWEKKIQGITGGFFQASGPFQIAINWNGAESSGSTVQMLTVPNDPVNSTWILDDISPDSLGEELLSADIDKDGDLDLFQSSNWLRNNGNGTWATIPTGIDYVTNPDRAQLADFDRDGDLDAVVGQLGIGTSSSERMEFAWFEAPSDPTGKWAKHILATDISSSLSLFTTDLDFDGDDDIVVGEWKGNNRLLVFENDLCNSGTWIRQTIDVGGSDFDHHDGAQVVDIDNDGDLDIVSIGWDNIVPRIFENKSSEPRILPSANAGEDQSITLPADINSLSGTGSDPDGGLVTFKWTQQNGPNAATLIGADTADLTLGNLIEGEYIFRLTVTDDENETAFDEVTLKVFPEVIVMPMASAQAIPLTGTSPLETSFTGSASTGDIVSYSWDFGDGGTSGETDPVHTFSSPGTYEVELTVTDGIGTTDSATLTIFVEPAVPLSASARAMPLTGTSPLETSFTGSASTGDIVSYSWDFGDGGTSGETDPVHTFSSPGTYEVELTVTDGIGTTDSATLTIFVEPAVPLSASARAMPLTGTSPLETSFTGSASTGDIVSYSWDFGDGGTSGETDPVHTFSSPGTYEVELTVTDGIGTTDSATLTIFVEPAVPLSASARAMPLTGTSPLETSFTGSASTGDIVSYSWDFGDGGTSGETDPVHTFSSPGTYEVELTVTDGIGTTDSATLTIFVEPAVPLSASARAMPLTGTSPLETSFTGSASTGDIVSYSWDFGDGGTSGETDPVHTFSSPGTYEVELTVTDGIGTTDSATLTIFVEPAVPLSASARAMPLTGTSPLETSFTGSASTGDIVSYSWDFGDGGTSGETDPVHTFSSPGNYEVELTVTDGIGTTDSATLTIFVEPAVPLSASARAMPLTGTSPLETSFTGSASTGDIVSYSWDFGDGGTSGETDPVHTFSSPGTYEVELTVTDGIGTTDSATLTIFVEPAVPLSASARAMPLTGTSPLETSFTGSASTGDIVSYSWDFGDGGTSGETDPVHTFSSPGTYEVELTVTDGIGTTDSATLTIFVEPAVPLSASARAMPLTGTSPLETSFTGSASTGDIVSYSWDFGDGGTSGETDPVHTFSSPGTYEVELTVTDGIGTTDSATLTIFVEPAVPLSASARAMPLTGTSPLETSFTGSASTGDIVSYSWDFGDGGTSGETDPVHTFSSPGTYEVELTVTDNTGKTSLALVEITVAYLDNGENMSLILENNPSKNGMAIIRVLKGFDEFTISTINMHDQLGRRIGSFKPNEVESENTYQIPVHTLLDGLYYFNIEIEKGEHITLKLLVKNSY